MAGKCTFCYALTVLPPSESEYDYEWYTCKPHGPRFPLVSNRVDTLLRTGDMVVLVFAWSLGSPAQPG